MERHKFFRFVCNKKVFMPISVGFIRKAVVLRWHCFLILYLPPQGRTVVSSMLAFRNIRKYASEGSYNMSSSVGSVRIII